jgi:hypothetical protein
MKTVPLHGEKAAGRVALVDDADYELVSQYRWHVWQRERAFYAAANVRRPGGRRTTIKMHNLILGYAGIDHRNGNGLDNQRANLRPATQSQNVHNMRSYAASSSPFKGVSWDGQRQRWTARIFVGGRKRHLGRFTVEEDAARAYDAAALTAWGSYAWLNFKEHA